MIRGDQRYRVRIRFQPRVAGNVEEVTWHKTQVTQRMEDDALLFEVEVDGIEIGRVVETPLIDAATDVMQIIQAHKGR